MLGIFYILVQQYIQYSISMTVGHFEIKACKCFTLFCGNVIVGFKVHYVLLQDLL